MINLLIRLLFLLSFSFCWESSKVFIPKNIRIQNMNIHTGLDILEATKFNLIQNKSIGLVINHTTVNQYGNHIIDLLNGNSQIKILKLFGPEHGIKGKYSAGETINSEFDELNRIEIISLYGKKKKPSANDLNGIELMVYDIQDIGSRYYTYISTMTYIIEACAENNIPLIILDRPNPLGGKNIRGPILDKGFTSFVGMHEIPIVHGMTSGELAIMINELNWINSNKKADLTIIPIINWQRNEIYMGQKIGWIPPSPNIPDFETAVIYTGFCLLEGTNLSEGRGTHTPFKIGGAPWFNFENLENLNNENYGLNFEEIQFTPISIENMSKWPKFENKNCNGYKISLDLKRADPLHATVKLIETTFKNTPESFEFLETNFIDKLYGSDKLRKIISDNGDLDSLVKTWSIDEERFRKKRAKFLIYN